ncbi:ADP-ribosylglycohydrolase family protein [Haloferula sp.]|uniref:ADP-ribosylglycohydrolase family protein n=1 Tax=Haloferula sp. TaxID=2497595 RepID=UPI00329F0DAB
MTPRDLIFSSFYADAISLGPHWIYDGDEIEKLYPSGLTKYDKPRSPYHVGKSAGDFTHYGEQTLALLRSLANSPWSIGSWRANWMDWAKNTKAYMDGASKRTLENLEAGLEQPSESSDLAGATRIAPLFACLDGAELIQAARAQTALTHGDPQVIDAAEFYSRAALDICGGANIDEAFDQAASHPYDGLPAIDWLAEARQAAEGDLTQAARQIGLACNVRQAFPLSLAVALKHQNDPVTALTTNALLGGDSAARGMPLGLLLGAKHGLSAYPDSWRDELIAGDEINAALVTLSA